MIKKILCLTLGGVSLFAMHTAELNINDLELEAAVKFDIGQFNDNVEPDTTFIGITYLNANEDYSENAKGTPVAELGEYLNFNFLMKQNINNSDLKIGLGVKAVFSSMDNPDLGSYAAMPLGVELEYTLPIQNVIPISLDTQIYYAPESLSFSNSKSYLEYRLGASFEVIERGALYVGFRNIETNYDAGDFVYNRAGYFGFKFSF